MCQTEGGESESKSSEAPDAKPPMAQVLRDLQTPVALLELSLQCLAGDLRAATPDTRASLRDAMRAGRRIQQYIDHFVAGEIFGTAALRPWRRQVELAVMLRTLIDEYATDASNAGKSIELEVTTPAPSVRADETLLERAFQRLIETVLWFPRARHIHLQARGGSVAEVWVSIECEAHSPSSPCDELGFTSELETCSAGFRRLFGTVTLEESSAQRIGFVVRLPAAAI